MTVRLYFDEDSSDRALVSALRARGVDVITAQAAGMIAQPDQKHLEFAVAHGRVLYSFNVGDFCRLHAEGHSHAGLVVAQQQRYSVGEQLRRLLRLMASVPAEQMRNRLEFLSNW